MASNRTQPICLRDGAMATLRPLRSRLLWWLLGSIGIRYFCIHTLPLTRLCGTENSCQTTGWGDTRRLCSTKTGKTDASLCRDHLCPLYVHIPFCRIYSDWESHEHPIWNGTIVSNSTRCYRDCRIHQLRWFARISTNGPMARLVGPLVTCCITTGCVRRGHRYDV